MKLTNKEIFIAKVPLKELLGKEMPVKVSYCLATLASKLDGQYMIIDNVRQGLVKTYGEQDPRNPNQFWVNPSSDNYQKFQEELEELMAQEFEIVYEPVTLPDTIEIKPIHLMALEKFITIK